MKRLGTKQDRIDATAVTNEVRDNLRDIAQAQAGLQAAAAGAVPYGSLALFPSAALHNGTSAWATNTGVIYQSDGATWQPIGTLTTPEAVQTAITDRIVADTLATLVAPGKRNGDGKFYRGRTYWWDSTNTETANGVTVIATTAGAVGRWIIADREWGWNVKWFGAKGDGVTDDSDAIEAAFNALPYFTTDVNVLAQGGIRPRNGALFFPSGIYRVSRTVRPTAGTKWFGDKGQYSTILKALPGFAPDAATEVFLVDVAASLRNGNPSGNITHGIEWANIAIDCNGMQNNAGISGMRWTGAESNGIYALIIGYHRKRGLVLNDRSIPNFTPGNSTFIDRAWITGSFSDTSGPGLEVNGNGHKLGVMTVQHHNTDGTFLDIDGEPMPGVLFNFAYGVSVDRLEDEDNHVFLKGRGSQQILIHSAKAARTSSQPQVATSCGLRLTGDTYMFQVTHMSVARMATAIYDTSASNGITNNYTKPGSQTGTVYAEHVPVKFELRAFIGGGTQNNTDTLNVNGLTRITNSSAGAAARLIVDGLFGQAAQLDLAHAGVSVLNISTRPDLSNRTRLLTSAGAQVDLQTNGTLSIQPSGTSSPARIQLLGLSNGAQLEYYNNGTLYWTGGNRPDQGNIHRVASAVGTVMDWDQSGLVKFYASVQFTPGLKSALGSGTSGRVNYITDAAAGRSGLVVANNGVWLEIPGALTATATLDFPSIPAQGQAELTVTVTGASVGDSVSLGRPAAPESGTQATGRVSAANTVTVRMSNITAAAIDPAAASYKVTVHK
ncbi:glycosyl hydrolase family 28-related protein [Deinococcus sp. A31D244]|uniref:glycosyl hydrolase family 28-related protein n=1 Tax=Deinococcus sp. A31D244 TaxID=3397675 RepID=UPI0039E18535